MQKTWRELLGYDPRNYIVDGKDISVRTGLYELRVVWTAFSHKQALAIFEAWMYELGL